MAEESKPVHPLDLLVQANAYLVLNLVRVHSFLGDEKTWKVMSVRDQIGMIGAHAALVRAFLEAQSTLNMFKEMNRAQQSQKIIVPETLN